MQNYSVSVPCKKYIKKYYNSVYGENVDLDHRTDFGDTVLTKMSSRSLAQVSKKIIQLQSQHYDDKIRFVVPFTYYYRFDNNLTQEQVYNINRYLENCFEDDLFLLIRIATFFGIERNTCIRTVADKCNIILDEDISFDSLRQQERRYRSRPTARNFFLLQMSSPFSWNLRA